MLPSEDDGPSTSGAVLTTGVTDNPTGPTDNEGSGTDALTGTSAPGSGATSAPPRTRTRVQRARRKASREAVPA